MISKNTEIVICLKNTFDYAEYIDKCKEGGILPDTRGGFFQLAGLITGAKIDNPSNIKSAYLAIIKEMNDSIVIPVRPKLEQISKQVKVTPCGSCGGGKVV